MSSKRSATTVPTVGPTKSSSSGTKKSDVSNKPCKLCAQDTVLAAPTVKRKGEPLPSTPADKGTLDGRKIGENKLLSKTSKTTRYDPLGKREMGERRKAVLGLKVDGRFSPYGGMCESCGGRTNRAGAKFCHACAYQKGCCVHGKKILDTSGYKQTTK